MIREYDSLIEDSNSRPSWALADLKEINHDLLLSIESADEEAAEKLLLEARVVLAEVIRLIR